MRQFEGRGADILAECLIDAGVDLIFGVPGDTGVVFYDALYQRTDLIRHVLARDERHAAFMADGYARTTNRVGVCEVSSGGGADFLVSGLGEAYAASVPILAITSDIHRSSRGSGAITEINQEMLFSAVTNLAMTIESAKQIPDFIRMLLHAATTGRPAPVVAIFPEDVFDEHASVTIPEMTSMVPLDREAASSRAAGKAAELLADALKPAIVAGGGVHLSAAWSELQVLVEKAGIPVATTIHGKGAIAETHPLSLGVVGANGARPFANQYLAEADVVLFVGTRANSTDTNGFTSPPRVGPQIIQIDIDTMRAGRNFPQSHDLVGDAKTTLQLIVNEIPEDAERGASIIAQIREWRSAWRLAEVEPRRLLDADLLDPRDVIIALQEEMPADVVVVAEPGTPTPNVAAYWECPAPGRTVIDPRGHGPMGYVIPAAMGVSLADPERSVLGLCGDGSFAMACGELETAHRLNLPIFYVQFTNNSLGWIKMLQHLYLGQRYFGVDPGPMNYVGVATAMGLDAVRVNSLEQLREAVREWLTHRRPTFIDVPTPDPMTLTPPVAPWVAALEGATNRPVY
jgi:acetolactate synthase I/II/III large subunit